MSSVKIPNIIITIFAISLIQNIKSYPAFGAVYTIDGHKVCLIGDKHSKSGDTNENQFKKFGKTILKKLLESEKSFEIIFETTEVSIKHKVKALKSSDDPNDNSIFYLFSLLTCQNKYPNIFNLVCNYFDINNLNKKIIAADNRVGLIEAIIDFIMFEVPKIALQFKQARLKAWKQRYTGANKWADNSAFLADQNLKYNNLVNVDADLSSWAFVDKVFFHSQTISGMLKQQFLQTLIDEANNTNKENNVKNMSLEALLKEIDYWIIYYSSINFLVKHDTLFKEVISKLVKARMLCADYLKACDSLCPLDLDVLKKLFKIEKIDNKVHWLLPIFANALKDKTFESHIDEDYNQWIDILITTLTDIGFLHHILDNQQRGNDCLLYAGTAHCREIVKYLAKIGYTKVDEYDDHKPLSEIEFTSTIETFLESQI